MPYGWLSPEMEAVLTEVVRDREVWDLGAGDHVYARRLVAFGASRVVAVEKAEGLRPRRLDARIEPRQAYFVDVRPPRDGIDVAFLSWPQNTPLAGLLPLLEVARVVVYLGKNTDGAACGSPRLYEHLGGRQVLHHIPHRRNVFAVYGDALPEGTRRVNLGEELAGCLGMLLSFEDAEAASAKAQQAADAARDACR